MRFFSLTSHLRLQNPQTTTGSCLALVVERRVTQKGWKPGGLANEESTSVRKEMDGLPGGRVWFDHPF